MNTNERRNGRSGGRDFEGARPLGIRQGFATVIAVIVAAVGGILCAFLVEMSYSFFSRTNQQRMFYGDHVTVTDYIQAVKGRIVAQNIKRGEDGLPVLHGRNMSMDMSPVTHVSDLVLRFPESANEANNENVYSRDHDVGSWGMGAHRVRVKVYDVAYYYSQLADRMKNNPVEMAALPPPINVLAGQATGVPVTPEGEVNVNDTGESVNPPVDFPWEAFGAYTIRVELYDETHNARRGGTRPVRVAEESFFQVIDQLIN